MMITIGIIGCAFTGNSLFCQLIENLPLDANYESIHIKIFEKNPAFMRTGFPYQANLPNEWTLNTDASRFKLTPNGLTLKLWMEIYPDKWQKSFTNIDLTFVPRSLAGMYLCDLYEEHKSYALQKGIIVEEIFDEAVDLDQVNQQWNIQTRNKSHAVDFLYLCTGHVETNKFPHLTNKPNFISSGYDLKKLETIPASDPVWIIGGQAGFIDTVSALTGIYHHKGVIHSATRNPGLITAKGFTEEVDEKLLNDFKQQLKTNHQRNTLSLSEAKSLFWNTYQTIDARCTETSNQVSTRQALSYQLEKFGVKPKVDTDIMNIDRLRSFIMTFYVTGAYQKFWSRLTEEGQQEFNQHFYSLIFAYLSATTPANALMLIKLLNKNKLIEHSGLTQIEYDANEQLFILHFANGSKEQAKHVINASGLGYDISQIQTPLIKKMVEKGYLVPKKFGGIMLNTFNQLLDKSGAIQSNLFCIGPIASYNQKYPTTYASFIAINTIQSILKEINPVTYALPSVKYSLKMGWS